MQLTRKAIRENNIQHDKLQKQKVNQQMGPTKTMATPMQITIAPKAWYHEMRSPKNAAPSRQDSNGRSTVPNAC
jgi:hypothetical protein